MSTQLAAPFSSKQTSLAHAHNRQISVASFASSLYLPVDPDNPPIVDDEADVYPSSDELFGPDHEEGDDYTISSRRYLSSSRYSSQPPTPPRSTRSTISLERTPSSSSLTLPHPRHSNTQISCLRTMTSTAELPSPPSTAHSSVDTYMSASLDKCVADQGVPIDKFDQLALEHLEQDKALLQVLRKLDDQKVRIAQLTYALSRLRIMSNSACLVPTDSDAPVVSRAVSTIQPRRTGAVIPKPLIVQQSPRSATFGRSAIFTTTSTSGLSGPSQNEAVNQRRRAKQQLHEFALRRPARMAKGRATGKQPVEDAAARAKRTGWEGTRGSPSLVLRETKPRSAAIGHPNVTVRRPKRPDPPPHLAKQSATLTPRPSAPVNSTLKGPATPPRLLSLFSAPVSRSPRTPTQSQIFASARHDSPTTPVPFRKNKEKSFRSVSPTMPMRLARNISFKYEIPPVPPPEKTTAHITLVDRTATTPPLPVEEVRDRLAATFAHFSKSRPPSYQPPPPSQTPSPPRQALEFPTPASELQDLVPSNQPDYLEQMLHQKWVSQLDEHSHQARGSWKSPLKAIKQKLAGGFGIGGGASARRPSRASLGDSSSDAHSNAHSIDVAPGGYVHGLGTVQEGSIDSEYRPYSPMELASMVEAKTRKSKKKGGKDESSGGLSWRFSRQGS